MRVFISSTIEDLELYRDKAVEAVNRAGCTPVLLKYFGPSGHKPLKECLAQVDQCDLLVVIVAYRYGWVPEDQPTKDRKSITWLECEEALREGENEDGTEKNKIEVLPFLVDKDYAWLEEFKEKYRIMRAYEEGKLIPELQMAVKADEDRLADFKAWLGKDFVWERFTTPDDLGGKVTAALLKRRIGPPPPPPPDPERYLQLLRGKTAEIEIRGLKVGSGDVLRIPIDSIYIPVTATMAGEEPQRKRARRSVPEELEDLDPRASRSIPLDEALRHRLLAVVGDPGSGKSTFVNYVAHRLCTALLAPASSAAIETIPGLAGRPFPALIPLAHLWQHIEAARQQGKGPLTVHAPSWFAHYLAAECAGKEIELKEEFFRARLKGGPALLLLDGLDEAPSAHSRAELVLLIREAAQAYEGCRFVVTTRPAAYVDDAVLPGFLEAQIDELEKQAIDAFLRRWCDRLLSSSPTEVEPYFEELRAAVGGTPEIRRMARNPVMLTALAVVHRQEKQLPEQRADLYESIVDWLAKARKLKQGRPLPERCIGLLQTLALAMQDHPKGRQRQVTRDWAARAIAPAFREIPKEDRVERAERFLQEEELDSGLVVGRGERELQFWHLTFQEYLAARALAVRDDRRREFLSGAQLYQPEWREVALLLAGVLYHRGQEGVDAMVATILDRLGKRPSLADQARVAGLLGACVRDLAPVHYQPADPRYQQTLDAALGVFDATKARDIEFRVRLEAAEALGQAGDPRLRENNWIEIEAGKFWMGAQKENPSTPNYDSEALWNESPVHEVYLDAYQIGRYPVTVEEYRRFVEDDDYENDRWWKAGGFGNTKEPEGWDEQVLHPNRPVVGVSWYEAKAYCAWRTDHLPGGVRLPTEAEWERAARGTAGRKYPWGNEAPDPVRANYASNVGHPTPVGLYPRGATLEGIHDMAGNVWEWVGDSYDRGYYRESPSRNPKGASSGSSRVVRGGSWDSYQDDARATSRNDYHPDYRPDSIGFRVVGVVPSS